MDLKSISLPGVFVFLEEQEAKVTLAESCSQAERSAFKGNLRIFFLISWITLSPTWFTKISPKMGDRRIEPEKTNSTCLCLSVWARSLHLSARIEGFTACVELPVFIREPKRRKQANRLAIQSSADFLELFWIIASAGLTQSTCGKLGTWISTTCTWRERVPRWTEGRHAQCAVRRKGLLTSHFVQQASGKRDWGQSCPFWRTNETQFMRASCNAAKRNF